MSSAPAKPPYGSLCNGCGECCRNELCPLGELLYRRVEGPCPALSGPVLMTDGSEAFSCGLVALPEMYAPVTAFALGRDRLSAAAKMLVGVGAGCDSQAPGEPDNPEYHAKLVAEGEKCTPGVARALAVWAAVAAFGEPRL